MLTLVMAIVGMMGWLRSRDNFDSLGLNGDLYRLVVASADNRLHLFCTAQVNSYQYIKFFTCKVDQVMNHNRPLFSDDAGWKYEPLAGRKIEWRRDLAGFHASEFTSDIDVQAFVFNSTFPQYRRITYGAVPYYSIVIPLTAISAYLLLSKPRPLAQKKITEPTADEGA